MGERGENKRSKKLLNLSPKGTDGLYKCGVLPKETRRNACWMPHEMAVQILLSYRIFKFTTYRLWSHVHIFYSDIALFPLQKEKYVRKKGWRRKKSCVHTILLQILPCHELTCTFFLYKFCLRHHRRTTKAATYTRMKRSLHSTFILALVSGHITKQVLLLIFHGE